MRKLWIILAALTAVAVPAFAERVKDIVDIRGVRGNPIWGYGIVIGLNGTGDNSVASQRALANILRRSGLVLNPADTASKNIASVLVTADLGPFARKGTQIDVTVSAIGNASSLQGGTLIMMPMTGADGQVYAVAQGAVSIGGFSASGEASAVTKNHATVGRIPAGAVVEKEEIATFVENGKVALQLRNADFATAQRIAAAVNEVYAEAASAEDASTITVRVPKSAGAAGLTEFLGKLGQLEVKVDSPALVVINERTGTIVVGENVRISTVAISHGNLSIITQEKGFVSQPQPFSATGTTERIRRTDITAVEEKAKLVVVPQVSVAELARALNAMGLTPRDLIAIFQALKRQGALQAQLEIM